MPVRHRAACRPVSRCLSKRNNHDITCTSTRPCTSTAVRQAIAKALVAFYQKYVDEAAKREIKNTLMEFDRTLLVADPRRPEPKKYVGDDQHHQSSAAWVHTQVWWSRRPLSLPKVVPLNGFGGGFAACVTHFQHRTLSPATYRIATTPTNDAVGRLTSSVVRHGQIRQV